MVVHKQLHFETKQLNVKIKINLKAAYLYE